MAIKRIKLRLDTEANFITANPLLANGEVSIAVLSDGKRKIKIGDGYTSWVNLAYRNDQDYYQELINGINDIIQNHGERIDAIDESLESLAGTLEETTETQSQHSETIELLLGNDQEHEADIDSLSHILSNYELEFTTINSRITALEDPRITDAIVTELREKNAQQDSRLDNMDADNLIIQGAIDALEEANEEQDSEINDILNTISILDDRIQTVETNEGGYNNQFTQLQSKTASLKSRLDDLENAISGDEGDNAAVQNQIEQVIEALNQEITVRTDTDSDHETALGQLDAARINEQIARIDADTALGERIDQEIEDRETADTELDEKIDQEIEDRETADTELEQQITENHALFQAHENSADNPHSVTKAQVGLSAVDNTSDTDKPVSTAQSTAIEEALDSAKEYTDEQIAATVAGTLHFKGEVATFDDLPQEDNERFDLWAVLDIGKGYYWFNDEWNLLDFSVDLSQYYTRNEVDTSLDTKVDKVTGKGLSQNDFSNEYLQLLQATSGALKVFHDAVTYTADVYEDILVTRYMFRSNLSVTGSYLEIIIDNVSFRVIATSNSNLRTELKSAIPGQTITVTIRRNTFYDNNTEGQTIQNRVLDDTAYVIDSTIYVNSNDYSIYQLLINDHWWELNMWPANSKTAVLISLERRL